jgi:hypothetical protein
MQRHQVQRTLGRRAQEAFCAARRQLLDPVRVCLREDAAATEGRQDRLVAVTTLCDGASRSAEGGTQLRGGPTSWHAWTADNGPARRHHPAHEVRCEELPRLKEPATRKRLAGVVLGEAA